MRAEFDYLLLLSFEIKVCIAHHQSATVFNTKISIVINISLSQKYSTRRITDQLINQTKKEIK